MSFLENEFVKKLNKCQNNCNVACDFLCFSFIKKQPKFWPTGNIDLPGSLYSLHGYSGRLGARLTFVEKANWTCSRHSMLFLIAARDRVKIDVVIMIICNIVIIINSVLTLQVSTASLPHDCGPCEIKVVFIHTWFASYLRLHLVA